MRDQQGSGLCLTELLVALALMAVLAGFSVNGGLAMLARQQVEVASRRLEQGLERARAEAVSRGEPCGLSLRPEGWVEPLAGSLPACGAGLSLQEPIDRAQVQVVHNLPQTLRFTASGLVLDGGTVVLRAAGTPLQRCLVIALPLGITRLGRYQGGVCEADLAL